MSGLDEQNRDIVLCDCERFQYWTIRGDMIGTIGYLHSNTCMKKHGVKSITRWMDARDWSKESFIERIVGFRCHICGRTIEKGCDAFKRLYRDVLLRWNMAYVGD